MTIVSLLWKSLYLEIWSLYWHRVPFPDTCLSNIFLINWVDCEWILMDKFKRYIYPLNAIFSSIKTDIFIPCHYHLWWDDGLGRDMCWCVFCMTGSIIPASSSYGEGCCAEIVSTMWVTVASVAMVVAYYSHLCLFWDLLSESDLWSLILNWIML